MCFIFFFDVLHFFISEKKRTKTLVGEMEKGFKNVLFLHHLIVPCYSQMPKSFCQTSGSLIEQCLHAIAVMLDGLLHRLMHQWWRK
jgi:hypothetical protein